MKFLSLLATIYIVYLLFLKKKKDSRGGSSSALSPPKAWLADTKKKETIVSNDNHEDEELITFILGDSEENEGEIIASPCQRLLKSNDFSARWIQPEEAIAVGKIEITGGYVYFGKWMNPGGLSLSGYYDEGSEASLIDDTLKVRRQSYHYNDNSLGYWPRYSSLSPAARGAYLSWLNSNRRDALCPIGYVFIYFYGLERRVLVDSQEEAISDSEFRALFDEVYQLRLVFIENKSFRCYSSQLLDAMSILRPDLDLVSDWGRDSNITNRMQFKLALSKTVDAGMPVSADQALTWIINHTDYALRTPARRCPKEFTALFKSHYATKYGEGLIIKPNKNKLEFNYTSASPSLHDIRLPVPDLPDPSVLKGPTKKLIALADMCAEELNSYSRYLGRKDTSPDDIAAIILLPSVIINESAGKFLSLFKNWADNVISVDEGLVSVADFWRHMGAGCPEKINKREIALMQSFAFKMGYCFAPDPVYHFLKAEVGGSIVIFPASEGALFSPSSAFASAVMTIRLGAMVALTDNSLDHNERKVLEKYIEQNSSLSEAEKRSLYAYLIWQLNTPSKMTGVRNRIELLSVEEKAAVAKIIVGVACADGKIERTEIKQLEKIYSSLGLDPLTVSSNIHQYSTTEISSQASSVPVNIDNTGFTLDASVLARHESATNEVRRLLSSIFTENGPELEENVPQQSSQIENLDSAHNLIYQKLLEKKQWPRSEVLKICETFNLMLGGALEVINDWSYAVVDAPVLDDADDYIWVDVEIAKELEG